MSDLLRAPVVELAALVRRRALKPIELVDAHIKEILRWNPIINAVVANRFEEARGDARAQEAALVRRPGGGGEVGGLPPLFGVPFTVKECFGVAGLPHTSGSVLRAGRTADRSALVVERLVAAGGIPLGVTNMPEMAMWMETDNRVYGRTNNPHDPARTCGGSSGGEAAVVAAGASPFGVASDVGGSIRLPAFFCGVFGHKTTGGLVPADGHIPEASPRARRFVGIGPVARSARDIGPLLDVMSGHDPSLGDPRAVRIEHLTVHVVRNDGRRTPSPAVRTAQARAAAALKARGAHVVDTELPELKDAFDMWGDSLRATADKSFESWLGDDTSVPLGRELVGLALGRARHTVPALAFMALERTAARLHFTRGGHEKALRFQGRLRALLGDDAVILFPPYTTTAPFHGQALRRPGDVVLAAVWNVLDVAATAVPVGSDGNGLPSGVQVIGSGGNDRTTIAVAMALEEDLGGFEPAYPPRA